MLETLYAGIEGNIEHELLFKWVQVVGQKMGQSKEKLISKIVIVDLDYDIESIIDGLHKQLHALQNSKLVRKSKVISKKEAYKNKKQLTKLQDRYIDSCTFGNDV